MHKGLLLQTGPCHFQGTFCKKVLLIQLNKNLSTFIDRGQGTQKQWDNQSWRHTLSTFLANPGTVGETNSGHNISQTLIWIPARKAVSFRCTRLLLGVLQVQLIPLLHNVKKQKGIYVSGRYQWGHILGIQNPKPGVYVVALGTEEYGGH